MSALAVALDDYLALRRAVGFKVEHLSRELPKFVAFCEAEGADTITIDLALRWAGQRAGAPRRLGAVRVFARYLEALDPATEVPAPDLLPQRSRRRVPRLLSDEEVATLMAGCRRIRSVQRAATIETVVGLLFSTGIRVAEAQHLGLADVDLEAGTLVVARSKGQKSRLVPITESTSTALAHFRDRRPKGSGTAFFVTKGGGPVAYPALCAQPSQTRSRALRNAGTRLRGSGTSATASRCEHCFAGIERAPTSMPCCPGSRPISATASPRPRTGT